MKFTKTDVEDVWLVESEPVADERGWLARTFCVDEFAAHGLPTVFLQASMTSTARKGTLRGLHFQVGETPEYKLVQCTRGRIFDVVVDLRPDSLTFCRWTSITLDAETHISIFIPAGCAHGFLTLDDHCDLYYHMGAPYLPEGARGVRWNDPLFNVQWPRTPLLMSDRDRNFPDFNPSRS